jgi:hypothetical protein
VILPQFTLNVISKQITHASCDEWHEMHEGNGVTYFRVTSSIMRRHANVACVRRSKRSI